MFSCPTAVDEYFSRKISNLDLNFNKSDGSLRYQERVSFQERVKEAEDTKKRYPNKVPLVIEKHKSDKTLPHIDKIKWLVPQEMSLAQLTGVIKQRIKCPPHQELFLTLNHQRNFPSICSTLSCLHSEYSDNDGFLYLSYSSQEFYG